ncbi:GDSL-type esterase/lipase family protein [Allocoprobacillus halotolerans]|uniref:GDSL-type esterase/lipase family protein n=1 Tax=Allocoprobacillus halotolerans TaxID=2944914 RepID=A0ABY5I465_9FIRM|nr:GDSL-type esterase/lipase family protein [Allocoprobacillus halotolerans]UTY40136.1 GDSL-type esterase/lipase family protein [Allocoprobacillus halotolerans]
MRENMKYDTNIYQLRESVLKRMIQIIQQQRYVQDNSIVFYGDSIIEYYDVEHVFKDLGPVYNCGIGGITSDMLLHFVDEGVIKYHPAKVFILVGTNDLGNTMMASPRDIALNVKEMVEIIHYNLPECQIHLLSPIPCIENLHGYQSMHQGLRSHDTLEMIMQEYQRMIPYDYVHFMDIYHSLFENGQLKEDVFIDGLHINDEGYQIITQIIQDTLKGE